MASVIQTSLGDYLPMIASGKVREVYSLDKSTLLFVATDRISGIACLIDHRLITDLSIAYDVVMKNVGLLELLTHRLSDRVQF